MISNKKHFMLNLLTSYGNTLLNAVLSFVSVPLALNYWNREIYGIWTIITSFSTYIAACGLGIDSATGILATKNSDYNVKLQIVKKGFKLLLLCSFVIFGLLFLCSLIFPDWVRLIGKMDETNYPLVKKVVIIFILGLIINLPFNTIANSLQSIGKTYINSLLGTVISIINFVIILITISFKLSLPIYVLLQSINTILFSLIKLVLFFIFFDKGKKEYYSKLNVINKTKSPENSYKVIFFTGINMCIYGLVIMLVPNLSNLLISNKIDVKSVVPYSMSYKLYSTIALFWSNMNIAVSPIIGKEFGNDNWEWLKQNYKRMFECTLAISIFLITGVMWLSKPFILIWTGSLINYAGAKVSVVLALYFFIYALTNLNLCIINPCNYVKNIWVISWMDGIIFIISSSLLVNYIGVVAIPVGLFLGSLLSSSWGYPLILYKRSNRVFKYDFNDFTKYVLVFVISITLFIFNEIFNKNFAFQIFVDFLGIIATIIALFSILSRDFKHKLIKKIFKVKDDN